MSSEDDNADRFQALISSPQTKLFLGKIPPELLVATGHEDEVLLFFLRIGDAVSTIDTLRRIISVSETNSILSTMARTGGLLNKRFPIEQAKRIKQRLEAAGTLVEFIRPDEGHDMTRSQ